MSLHELHELHALHGQAQGHENALKTMTHNDRVFKEVSFGLIHVSHVINVSHVRNYREHDFFNRSTTGGIF